MNNFASKTDAQLRAEKAATERNQMKTIRFSYPHSTGGYGCSEPGDCSGEYVSATEANKRCQWYALLAKAGGFGDYAIGFVEGNPKRELHTIGYYGDDRIYTDDLDESGMPVETPERRALVESLIASVFARREHGQQ